MRIAAIDTETTLIQAGELSPQLVCVSIAEPGKRPELFAAGDGAARAIEILTTYEHVIFHNLGYDLLVILRQRPDAIDVIADALDAGRVTDTGVRQKLYDIATGCYRGKENDDGSWQAFGYSLDQLAQRHLNRKLDKSTWRLRYGELLDVPISDWPQGAIDYALMDAAVTLQIWQQQQHYRLDPQQEADRVRFDFVLYCMSREGMRTCPESVHSLQEYVQTRRDELEPVFYEHGLLKIKNAKHVGQINLFTGETVEPEYQRDVEALRQRVIDAYAENAPRTDKGNVKADATTFREAKDELLGHFAEYLQLLSVSNKDLEFLSDGFEPGAIHTRFDSLVSTGRTSSSNPNLQNIGARSALGVRIRNCFVPRQGCKFLDVDYGSAELHTLAQTCLSLFGQSTLADVLNSGKGPHEMMAARIGGTTYEAIVQGRKDGDEDAKRLRDLAKGPNYGFPGGMGGPKMAQYCLKGDVDLTDYGLEQLQKVTLTDLEKAYRSYRWQVQNGRADEKEPPPLGATLAEELLHWSGWTPAEYGGVKLKEIYLAQWREMPLFFRWVRDNMPHIRLPYSGRVRYTEEFTAACNYLFQGAAADAAAMAAWEIWQSCYSRKDSPLYGCKPVLFVHDSFLVEAAGDRAEAAFLCLKDIMVTEFNKVTPDVPVSVDGKITDFWSK